MNGGKGIYVGETLVSILISLALYNMGRREAEVRGSDLRAALDADHPQSRPDPRGGRLGITKDRNLATPVLPLFTECVEGAF